MRGMHAQTLANRGLCIENPRAVWFPLQIGKVTGGEKRASKDG
jgi:hypothetical protein